MTKRGFVKWGLWGLGAVVVLLIAGFWLVVALPFWGMPFNGQRHGAPPLTPAWALECWLWEDDVNTAEAVLELVDGYEKHDFPVRTILIDSPWSTRYNDFIVDERIYPNPEQFFKGLEDRGYRVVLWMTCMVDSYSKDTALQESADWFGEARDKGYLAGDGYEMKWWKGKGGFIDYTNPEAVEWWRGLQQQVLDWGVDGWKLDGVATQFSSKPWPLPIFPYQKTSQGRMTTRGYMDHYYRDEYKHGLEKNAEFITLSRALDRWWHPEGFAPIDAAPVTWVGDQDHAWTLEDEGIEEALTDILGSAKLGYCVIGSDVGGYGGGTIPAHVYIRWAQFSTFCGLFLNGGHGERAMWKRSEEELTIIRKFAWLHTELVPYIYSHVVACHNGGKPLMRPVKGKYHYLFGDDFLVAPIYKDELAREVTLPKGRWRYLFDDGEVIEGPKTFTRDYPLDECPVYVRDGAIVPLNVSRDYTGFGDKESEGFLTIAIYPNGKNSFAVEHEGAGRTMVAVDVAEDEAVEVQVTGVKVPHILRILMENKPASVEFEGQRLVEGEAWRYDAGDGRLWVRQPEATGGTYIVRMP